MRIPDWRPALDRAHAAAVHWLEGLAERPVRPERTYAEMLERLAGPVPEEGEPAEKVVGSLADEAADGLMAMNHARFHGWVIGGVMPAGVGAEWLVSAWDQNTAMGDPTPAMSAVETITAGWVLELLDLPRSSSIGFVTGGQVANLVCLAAGRDAMFRSAGWDVARDGLLGAPPVEVIVGDHVHHTVGKALRILGLGDAAAVRVACDSNARIDPGALRAALTSAEGPVIVCSQAGEVNTGGVDRFAEIADLLDAHPGPSWHHVDGAIGLWGRVSASIAPRLEGLERADSWSTDAHKWLNTPYDCGIAIVADAESHHRAMGLRAEYLPGGEGARNPIDWNPEMSRRSRATAVYATIRQLGRVGIEEMLDRDVAMARRIAAGLGTADGVEVLNEVELNQVLVRFRHPAGGDDGAHTTAVLGRVQESGVAYPTATIWEGVPAVRISVCNWSIEEEDADLTVAALLDAHLGVQPD